MTTITAISPVITPAPTAEQVRVIPAPASTDPNANGEYDLPTLVRLEADRLQRSLPGLDRDVAEYLADANVRLRLAPKRIGRDFVEVENEERRLENEYSHMDEAHR